MSHYEATFWRETEKYHELAKQFDQNIEIVSPKFATGGKNDCFASPEKCPWHATRIKYIEYVP